MPWEIARHPTDTPGLKYRPSIQANRWRWPPPDLDNCARPPDFDNPFDNTGVEFSACNRGVLRREITSETRSILEIGVCKGDEEQHERFGFHWSSTRVLLENKASDAVYVGVDRHPKYFIDRRWNNAFTVQCDSADQLTVMSRLAALGVSTIDLLLIDADHSVNAVLRDWALYVPHISPLGVVVLHDTNCHPGPSLVFEAIDEEKFSKERYCTDVDDWGIAVARRCS